MKFSFGVICCLLLALSPAAAAAPAEGPAARDIVLANGDALLSGLPSWPKGATPECPATLTLGAGQGQPGQTANPVGVFLNNAETVGQVQFTVTDIPNDLTSNLCSALPAGFACSAADDGTSVAIAFSGGSLPASSNVEILQILYDVDPAAAAGSVGLGLSGLVVLNDTGGACDVTGVDGSFEVLPVCGNGILESGEACDDGNTAGGDCCAADCTFEPTESACDDGVFCTAVDACDGAGACVGSGETDCDDGDICTDDSCDATTDACLNVEDTTNDPSCEPSECGNGIVEGLEACDDGNTSGGDCCAADCTFEPTESACDDGIFCTAIDVCDGAGACVGSGETDCDDGDICTDDSCDATSDACLNDFDVTNDPTCATCGDGVVEGDEQCDDGNTSGGDCCAADCTFEPTESACDDGVFCTADDTCDGAGVCLGGGETDCDDGDICTDDSCDATTDACLNVEDTTNDPSCEPSECGNGIVEGLEDCDDGNTADGDCCAADCTFEAVESACDDGAFCTANDACDGAGACLGGGDTDCDDSDICTDDTCDEDADTCVNDFDVTNDPTCATCGDGVVEGDEQCDDGNTSGGDCCAADCTFEAVESACDDGIFCTAFDVCDGAGACLGSGETDCDDGDICTDDSCDATSDACLNVEDTTNDPSCEPSECGNGIVEGLEDCDDGNTADGDCCAADCTFEAVESACDDGIFCTAVDACDGAGACLGSGETDCDDGDICTDDSCDAASDACLNVEDTTNDPSCEPAECGNGVLEEGESCDDGNTSGGDCCAADCTFEAVESTCDDGIFCTAVDACDGAGACLGSGETDCDDGDICTDDSCDADSDACLNVEDTTNDPSCEPAECGNGVLEEGESCDDGNTSGGDCCAADCTFEAVESTCDDGIFCTAVDACDGAGACLGSGETDCDDGDICTDDSCDAASDACLNVEDTTNDPSCEPAECGNGVLEEGESCDDGNTSGGDCCAADCTFEAVESTCDDGIFCTAVDACDGAGACLGSGETDCDDGDICTDDSCDAASDACLNVEDTTNDPSCEPAECGNGVLEEGESCDDGNTSDGDCCAADCTFEAVESTCDDGIFCTAVDACDGAGACLGSGETDCDDGDICTDDSCDAASDACLNVEDTTNDPSCEPAECGNGVLEEGESCDDGNTSDGDCCAADCTFEAVESTCDDGIFCTAVDACDGAGACLGSGETDCDDGDICTDDSCDAASDACLNVEDTTNDPSCEPSECGNGIVEGLESCDDGNTSGGDCCAADCTFEAVESTCDDGIFCTAVDACDGAGACLGSGETDCDDGDICTDDSCDAASDACLNVEDTTNDPSCEPAECGNGVLEEGESCDDGNTSDGDCCAADCTFEPAVSACDDGIFCTAIDICDGAGACLGSGEADCDDGDICTDDSCDAATDACLSVEDTTNDPSCEPAECGNGVLDAGETCDPPGDNAGLPNECRDDCTFCGDGVLDGGVSGNEMLTNGGMENWLDGRPEHWRIANVGGEILQSTDLSKNGASSVELKGAQSGILRIHQEVQLQPGGTYRFAFWARTETLLPLYTPRAKVRNLTRDLWLGLDGAWSSDGDALRGGSSVADAWEFYSVTFTVPAEFDPADTYRIQLWHSSTAMQFSLFYDDVSLLGPLADIEQCDDGNNDDGDGCRTDCTIEACGDGIQDPAEGCDDGNNDDGDGCRADCTVEECGDDILDAGEDCDDGNTDGGDGCRADCTVEVCGDGIVDPLEQCDDGNQVDGDGCNSDCTPGECGDGAVDPGEECDDGNQNDGDCCSSACLFDDAGASCEDGSFCSDGDACDGAGTCEAGGERDCDDSDVCTDDSCDEDSDTCVNDFDFNNDPVCDRARAALASTASCGFGLGTSEVCFDFTKGTDDGLPGGGDDITAIDWCVTWDTDAIDFNCDDSDQDGVPDDLAFFVDPGFATIVQCTPENPACGLRISILDKALPFDVLPDDTLACATFSVLAGVADGDSPVPFGGTSASDTMGASIPLETIDDSIALDSCCLADCNDDDQVDIADAVSVILELSDTDGNDFCDTDLATPFDGGPCCDCNTDRKIDIADAVCVVNGLGELQCPATAASTATAQSSVRLPPLTEISADDLGSSAQPQAPYKAGLTLVQRQIGWSVVVPVIFQQELDDHRPGGRDEITAFSTCIDFDQKLLSLDTTDDDLDGIPDSVDLRLPAGHAAFIKIDLARSACELHLGVLDLTKPSAALPDGLLAEIEFEMIGRATGRGVWVRPGQPDTRSFADVEGVSQPVKARAISSKGD